MLKKLLLSSSAFVVAVFLLSNFSPAFGADEFPVRPIKLIVPYSAGSSADISARRVGEAMSRTLGKPIIVENVGGAGGVVGTMKFLQQPADGYTLLAGAIATHAINVGLYKTLPYDPVKDFAPISRISSFPNILVVHPSVNARTLPELVSLLKKRTADQPPLSFGSGGKATTAHLGGEQLKLVTGADLIHVPYASVAVAVPDVLAGRVSMLFGNMPVVQSFIEKGSLIAIANTGTARSALLPKVPTVKEQGFEAMELSAWIGLFAPAGTPAPIVKQLHAAVRAAVATPEVRESFRTLGATPESDASPEDFGLFINEEIKRWVGVTKAAGIKPE